ncbi:PfkB family carbohydrate kinase [Haloarcula marismortui]|uniref:Nucleoside 2-deoxyribosyltransferase n=1 Tax=Haloarcula marismortui ATCC 33800 TaxID=662476 RepID=M0JQ54_9EURY|nr:PfkB family carbohydrate kinase [Haloarcula sinaiiensis]EMA09810.1 nucleoside 2-deoxyribosyltransferase [Haloarcula sinaiiensis ATCC 33800]QUJ74720.1 nucleoside 2-deoxyribosyltransferase [Haloarcula sinaiiensis ATCC 33800]
MIVVGGTYVEECEFPQNRAIWGPGLRGAAAIQEISGGKNALYTCLSPSLQQRAQMKAGAYNFEIKYTEVPDSITYHYLHNHSNPVVRPNNADTFEKALGPIDGESILRFGLVEGTAVVHGDRVVYDPQSADPDPFEKNGSEADKLAIVLNRHEAAAYTGKNTTDKMLEDLRSSAGADVAVIKCGASGAVVSDSDGVYDIPVYETEEVWNIGSGDIFTSVFAEYWAEQEFPPSEAAKRASLATAYYCSTSQVRIPSDLEEADHFEPRQLESTIGEEGPMVYLAAPFFTLGEFWLVEEVQRILEKEGANVFSPYHEVGRVGETNDIESVAEKDLSGVEECDVVLALTDNCDSGTFFELGYARKIGKPVIAYEHKPEEADRTMMEGSGCRLYGDLSTAILKTLWADR